MEQIGEVKLYHVAQAIKKGTKCVSSILLSSISPHHFTIQPMIYHHTLCLFHWMCLLMINRSGCFYA